MKNNAESELHDRYVPTAHVTCWPSGVPEVLNLREPVEFLHRRTGSQLSISVTIRPGKFSPAARTRLSFRCPGTGIPSDIMKVITRWWWALSGRWQNRCRWLIRFGTPHTDKIHVVERYRLIHDECGRGLEVVFTVDDPGAFTTPWKGHGNLSPQSRTV